MNKSKEMGINTYKKRLKELELICLDEIDENFSQTKKYKLKDKSGYLYNCSSMNLCTIIKRNGTVATFFNYNPYTYENINNYLRINNANLELITKDPKSAIEKLTFKCLKHDVLFERKWNTVLSGSFNCEICNKRTSHTFNTIKNLVSEFSCELLSNNYDNVHEKYKFRCQCGKVFTRRMSLVIYQGLGKCNDCTGTITYNYDTVKNDLSQHGIILLDANYNNINEKLEHKYPCGFIAKRSYGKIRISEYKCPHCNNKGYKRNTIQFYEEIEELVGLDYSFEGEYIDATSKMTVKHNVCGNKYEVAPQKFINCGQRCPVCASSKSEEIIAKYLKENGINFTPQYSFDDLIGIKGGILRFDFGIINNSNEVFLIEYDGEYHYKPIDGIEKLEIQKEHDKRKDEYCKDNNIKLYRIAYWEKKDLIEKLEEILTKEGFYGKRNCL